MHTSTRRHLNKASSWVGYKALSLLTLKFSHTHSRVSLLSTAYLCFTWLEQHPNNPNLSIRPTSASMVVVFFFPTLSAHGKLLNKLQSVFHYSVTIAILPFFNELQVHSLKDKLPGNCGCRLIVEIPGESWGCPGSRICFSWSSETNS